MSSEFITADETFKHTDQGNNMYTMSKITRIQNRINELSNFLESNVLSEKDITDENDSFIIINSYKSEIQQLETRLEYLKI